MRKSKPDLRQWLSVRRQQVKCRAYCGGLHVAWKGISQTWEPPFGGFLLLRNYGSWLDWRLSVAIRDAKITLMRDGVLATSVRDCVSVLPQ